MDFLQALKAHKGRLILIKSNLFWHGGRGWDNSLGRIYLVLDASAAAEGIDALGGIALFARVAPSTPPVAAAVLLLIDGAPHWVWVGQADVELIA